MPITRGAKKKLKQDIKRQKRNTAKKLTVKQAIKKFKRAPTQKLLSQVYSLLDTLCKRKIIQANKVSRLKSNLAKLLTVKKTTKPAETTKKPKKKNTT